MPESHISQKLLLGAHCSAAGGPHQALLQAEQIGATTLQLFTSNQKQWASRPYSDEQVRVWREKLQTTGMRQVMSHDSYLINLGSGRVDILEKSRAAFRSEIERCSTLGCAFLNFHPGSAVGDSKERCLSVICESLLEMRDLFESEPYPLLLLETMAGQGSQVGASFRELAFILERVGGQVPLGICLDTCHVFAAGYDIRTPLGWERVLAEFDQEIGQAHLKALHCNDSARPLGSRVDRHAPLGKGEIGWAGFEWLMRDVRMRDLPKYLETPDGPTAWREEIAHLRAAAH